MYAQRKMHIQAVSSEPSSTKYAKRGMFTMTPILTICMLSNFSCFCCHLLTFFRINFKLFFSGTHSDCQTDYNRLDPDQDCHSDGPDLGPNCFQRLLAGDNNCH